MNSAQAPLVRDLFRAVADGLPRAEITTLQQEIATEKATVLERLHKADKWFSKHGGWGSADPDPLPDLWHERTEKYQQFLWDYQMLQCSQFLMTALLLEGE